MSRLSAADIKAADIEAIERATVATVAHDRSRIVGDWVVALRAGTIGRAHSAAALAHDLGDDAEAVALIEAAYRAQGMAPVFRLADVEGLEGVAASLRAAGYVPRQPTLVMAAEVAEVAAFAEPADVQVMDQPDAAWTAVFQGEGFDPEDGALRAAVLAQAPGAVFAAVRDAAGTHAVGAAAFAHGWASLHGMRTAKDMRGRGMAGRAVAALARAVQARGAERMFLQVEEANAPARSLYGRAGFAPLWRYFYWRR